MADRESGGKENLNPQQEKVSGLIARIEKHQQALTLSDRRFVARYQEFLKSTDTWRRGMIPRDWSRLGARLDKWQALLARLVASIDGGSDLEDVFEELPITEYGQELFDMLQGQRTDRRVGWIIGPTGVGKSFLMHHLARQNPLDTAFVHVRPNWMNNMTRISAGLAFAVGAKAAPTASLQMDNVAEALKANAMTLMIDDLHEGGNLMLRIVKHLVDDTRAKFILGTYPTAWNRLVRGSTDAACEMQQLIGRSIKPINRTWMAGLTMQDVMAYLRACKMPADRVLCDRITPILNAHLNFRGLADAIDLIRMKDESGEMEITGTVVTMAVQAVCDNIGKRKSQEAS